MKKVELRYLSQEDILSLDIGWEDIIQRVEMALSEQAKGTIENPPKRGVHTRPDTFIHEMPVFLKGMDACGIKWVSGYPENYKHDLPQILGVQIMNSTETGVPLAVMDLPLDHGRSHGSRHRRHCQALRQKGCTKHCNHRGPVCRAGCI